jgi:hypothetical protein
MSALAASLTLSLMVIFGNGIRILLTPFYLYVISKSYMYAILYGERDSLKSLQKYNIFNKMLVEVRCSRGKCKMFFPPYCLVQCRYTFSALNLGFMHLVHFVNLPEQLLCKGQHKRSLQYFII